MADLIDEKKDKVFLCRYKVKNLIFSKGGDKIEMDAFNILSIEKLDDYDFNIRSILKVSLRMDIRRKLWILKNKREITCKFELEKIGHDRDLEDATVGPEKAWNLQFKIYLNDEDEAVDTKNIFDSLEKNEAEYFKEEELENEDYFESQNTMDVYLFNAKLLKASQKIYNEVITSGTMQNIVARMLTKTGHSNILMSKIENTKTYKELLIPAYPAYKALVYLDQYYGLYKFGAMIYYDLNKMYIINPNGKVTAKEEEEWTDTIFLITTMNKSIPDNGMVRKPGEKKFYINITEEDISPQKPSITRNEELGSEARIVISDGTSISVADANQTIMSQRNEFIRYVRSDENAFTGSSMKARMEENECIVYISGNNFDISAFALNKTYKLIFEEPNKQKRYGKYKYRLAYAYHYLKAQAEGYMISSHRIVLKKCSG